MSEPDDVRPEEKDWYEEWARADKRIATLVAALRAAKRLHTDECMGATWVKCTCGAEAHNAAIDAAIEEAG